LALPMDAQLDIEVEIPRKMISCPRYPGCRMNLYRPVSMNLWFSTFATEYVKYCFCVSNEWIRIINPMTNKVMPIAKKVFQACIRLVLVAPIANDRA